MKLFVQDVLTRKWILIKEDKQLGDWSLHLQEARTFQQNTATINTLMKGIRKLTQVYEKMKKKKKAINT